MTTSSPLYPASVPPRELIDPLVDPRLYEGVLSRRVLAFCVDFGVVATLTLIAIPIVGVIGLLTLGLGWLIYPFLFQAIAILYSGATLGGDKAATWGMRLTGLTSRLWHGAKPGFLIAAGHVIFLYMSITFLTPFILIVGLLTRRKQLLHDLVLGTLFIDKGTLEGRR